MTILYGITNCDTIKKARQWLDSHDVAYQYHDLKHEGIDRPTLDHWIGKVGLEKLVNRRGTTWCRLSDSEKESLDDNALIGMICQYPTLIKRPVIDTGSHILVGFDHNKYQHAFTNK